MNRDKLIRWLVITALIVSVFYPLWVWYGNANLQWDKVSLFEIFPAFGILAFTLMWQHIVGAPLKGWLSKYVNWKKFTHATTEIVLAAIILHPVLLYVAFALNGGGKPFDYVTSGQDYIIWAGIIGWLTLISFDVFRHLKGYDFVKMHWNKILIVSTFGFFIILLHSLGVGRDLQGGVLRVVWFGYGLTAALAAIYYYGFEKRCG